MIIKYKVDHVTTKPVITKVEVFKETEYFVYLKENHKEAKQGHYSSFFNTFDEAKTFIVKRLQAIIDDHKRKLVDNETHLAIIMAMTCDETTQKQTA